MQLKATEPTTKIIHYDSKIVGILLIASRFYSKPSRFGRLFPTEFSISLQRLYSSFN